MPVVIVPPAAVRVGDVLYGLDAKAPNWARPRRVTGRPYPCTVVRTRRRWPTFWRVREIRTTGYMIRLHSNTSAYGVSETLTAARVRVQVSDRAAVERFGRARDVFECWV